VLQILVKSILPNTAVKCKLLLLLLMLPLLSNA